MQDTTDTPKSPRAPRSASLIRVAAVTAAVTLPTVVEPYHQEPVDLPSAGWHWDLAEDRPAPTGQPVDGSPALAYPAAGPSLSWRLAGATAARFTSRGWAARPRAAAPA